MIKETFVKLVSFIWRFVLLSLALHILYMELIAMFSASHGVVYNYLVTNLYFIGYGILVFAAFVAYCRVFKGVLPSRDNPGSHAVKYTAMLYFMAVIYMALSYVMHNYLSTSDILHITSEYDYTYKLYVSLSNIVPAISIGVVPVILYLYFDYMNVYRKNAAYHKKYLGSIFGLMGLFLIFKVMELNS